MKFIKNMEFVIDSFRIWSAACYEFHQFNGYGNIDSFEDFDIIREMKNDTRFLLWHIDENKLIDWDEAYKIIEESNKLIAKGY